MNFLIHHLVLSCQNLAKYPITSPPTFVASWTSYTTQVAALLHRNLLPVIQLLCESGPLLFLDNIDFLLVVTISNGPIFIVMYWIAIFQMSIGCCSRVNCVHVLCSALLHNVNGTILYSVNPLCPVAGGPVHWRGADVQVMVVRWVEALHIATSILIH
jgi:hypothetical protein